jgi:AraC family transcriptional regulator, positive regulator of tynA and feaB
MFEPGLVAIPGGLAGLQAAISASYFPIQLQHVRGAAETGGAIATSDVGELHWTRTQVSGPFRSCRSPLRRIDERRRYVLMLLLEGGQVALRADGQSVVVAPGNLILLNTDSPLETEQCAAGTTLALSFAAGLLRSRYLDADHWCMMPLDATRGSAALLRECMLACWNARAEVHPEGATELAAALVHLLGAAFKSCDSLPAFESRSAGMHFLRIRQLVMEGLGDPDLSADFVAQQLRISKSYLFAIMSAANTTLGNYILSRRLERSREMLSDPSLRNRSIGDIAFSVGFKDLSHFSRRFSEHFGRSPRALRASACAAFEAAAAGPIGPGKPGSPGGA